MIEILLLDSFFNLFSFLFENEKPFRLISTLHLIDGIFQLSIIFLKTLDYTFQLSLSFHYEFLSLHSSIGLILTLQLSIMTQFLKLTNMLTLLLNKIGQFLLFTFTLFKKLLKGDYPVCILCLLLFVLFNDLFIVFFQSLLRLSLDL